ncbi:DMT family transporter [Hydrogenophaga sp.]|uniref:DMT family transporter n=1 Tax=Hydrogenophaga sp. TaxID=1904254 RepID=UPI003565D08C
MKAKPWLNELVLLLLLSTLWGASYTFIRLGVASIPPLTLMAARTLTAGLLLWTWMRMRGIHMPRTPAVWRRFLVQALLNSVLPFTLIAWAEQTVPAGLATILNSASPLFVFLATWWLAGHGSVAIARFAGVVLGFVGIALVVGHSALSGLGAQVVPQLAIVLASVCYAGAAIYGHSFHGLPAVVPAAGSLLAGTALLLPLSLVVDRPWGLQPSGSSVLALLALSVLSTAWALVIYFRLVQTLGSVGVTAQAYLRVPIGVGMGVVFLGESLSGTAWTGMALVVLGVAAMTVKTAASGR